MKKVIIVGSGFGGLATGALLGKQGYEVTIIEKNEQLGGRASVIREQGFTFDMGPSWYLMPDVFERYFALFDKKPSDYYKLIRLDPSYRIFFGGDKVVDIAADLEKNFQLFESLEKNGRAKLERYLKQSQIQYDISMKHFVYKTYDNWFDMTFVKYLPEAMKMNVLDSIERFARRFFDEDKTKKILQYNIVFLGGNLKNTPALYAIMAHIDFHMGVWYPDGGFGKIVDALADLGKEHNVTYILNEPVTKVIVENGKAVGVKTALHEYRADIVIMNADYHHGETVLLDKEYQAYPESYWKKATIAPSGFIMYIGLDKKIDGLSHHNLFLDNDWVNHFDTIFESPSWPDYPSYYVSCPSKTDSSVAPEGKENIFILVPVAAGLDDSDEIRQAYGEKILSHLETLLGEKIKDHIIVKKLFTHRDFASRYNAYKGTALGLTHSLFQSAWFRPRHKSSKVKNLFYTGAYTHPGIGVPMQLVNAEILAKVISD